MQRPDRREYFRWYHATYRKGIPGVPAPPRRPWGGKLVLSREQYERLKAASASGARISEVAREIGVAYTTCKNAVYRGIKRYEREARAQP